jgi:hypothetical protein
MKIIKRENCGKCEFQTFCMVQILFETWPGAHQVVFDDDCPADLDREARKDVDHDERQMAQITD